MTKRFITTTITLEIGLLAIENPITRRIMNPPLEIGRVEIPLKIPVEFIPEPLAAEPVAKAARKGK